VLPAVDTAGLGATLAARPFPCCGGALFCKGCCGPKDEKQDKGRRMEKLHGLSPSDAGKTYPINRQTIGMISPSKRSGKPIIPNPTISNSIPIGIMQPEIAIPPKQQPSALLFEEVFFGDLSSVLL